MPSPATGLALAREVAADPDLPASISGQMLCARYLAYGSNAMAGDIQWSIYFPELVNFSESLHFRSPTAYALLRGTSGTM